MEIDKIIEGLNKKENISGITISKLEDAGLNELEKNFIGIYKPEKALIVYGTLAPNQPNHSVVEHIKGTWQKGFIRGKLINLGWGAESGYYAFKPTSAAEQEVIKAFVLFSDELVLNWQMLDEFEGDEYRRILAKYELENGETGAGYIYAIDDTLTSQP